jgi:hypothetical protein
MRNGMGDGVSVGVNVGVLVGVFVFVGLRNTVSVAVAGAVAVGVAVGSFVFVGNRVSVGSGVNVGPPGVMVSTALPISTGAQTAVVPVHPGVLPGVPPPKPASIAILLDRYADLPKIYAYVNVTVAPDAMVLNFAAIPMVLSPLPASGAP